MLEARGREMQLESWGRRAPMGSAPLCGCCPLDQLAVLWKCTSGLVWGLNCMGFRFRCSSRINVAWLNCSAQVMAAPGRGMVGQCWMGGGCLTMTERWGAPPQSRGTGVLGLMLKSKAVQSTSTTSGESSVVRWSALLPSWSALRLSICWKGWGQLGNV